jgi:anti-sigma factor RsiW
MNHVSDRLVAYLAEELDPRTRAAVADHLAACAACAAELEECRRTWDLLETARVRAPRSPGAWEAVRARTTARPPWFFGAGPWVRRGWATAAVAAGLVFGVVVPTILAPGAADAEASDPVLAGTAWNDDAAGDLAGWWLATALDEEAGR